MDWLDPLNSGILAIDGYAISDIIYITRTKF